MKKKFSFILPPVFIIYIMILLRITVFRSNFNFSNFFNGQIELIPFLGLFDLLKKGDFLTFTYLFIGNIIWFVPFGFLLPLLKKPNYCVVLYGFLLSFLIEFFQYIFGTGISEIEDLLLNTLGCFLGYRICLKLFFKKNSR